MVRLTPEEQRMLDGKEGGNKSIHIYGTLNCAIVLNHIAKGCYVKFARSLRTNRTQSQQVIDLAQTA